MVDEAVYCEPFSGSNSLMNRENRGNSAVFRLFRRPEPGKIPELIAFIRLIPLRSEQGILLDDQGIAIP
jgi:hypothetical protein